MVAQGWEETVFTRTCSVCAGIWENKIVIVLANIGVDRIGCAGWVIIVADRDDEIRTPAVHQRSHIRLGLVPHPEVTDHSKVDG